MEKGKLIVIEGTDCSGKETQSKMLIERLNDENIETKYFSFPKYDTPTGMMVGLAYLGKPYLAEKMVDDEIKNIFVNLSETNRETKDVLSILKVACLKTNNIIDRILVKITLSLILKRMKKKNINLRDQVLIATVLDQVKKSLSHGWFPEGAPDVDPKVASLFYAADRRYNLPKVNSMLENGTNIILDRYTYSSMAHQGGKISDKLDREAMFKWIAELEFDYLELPLSDARIFLHMPTDYANFLKAKRNESLDEHEKDRNHLYNAEKAYLELASMYDFNTIECIRSNHQSVVSEDDIKTPEEINDEVYSYVKKELKLN